MVRKRTFKADSNPVPETWRRIAEQSKQTLAWPEWPEVVSESGVRVQTRRDDVHTFSAETIQIVIPLADEHGVGMEGVSVRLVAWPFRRQYDVTGTLEVLGGRRHSVVIARVDAWPPDDHMNVQARGHPALGHLPLEVQGHHVHRFADNAKLGRDAFGAGNLPLAAPVTRRLESFRDFLRICGEEFRIKGLDQVDPPDWTVMI